jgi:DNA-binding FrmR family transcriptional regulator
MANTTHRRRRADEVSPDTKQRLLLRLRRIEVLVRGLQRMIEEERYCPDVLQQMSAVHESLRGIEQVLLRSHLEHCATNAIRSEDQERARQTYEELTKLFYRHAR